MLEGKVWSTLERFYALCQFSSNLTNLDRGSTDRNYPYGATGTNPENIGRPYLGNFAGKATFPTLFLPLSFPP